MCLCLQFQSVTLGKIFIRSFFAKWMRIKIQLAAKLDIDLSGEFYYVRQESIKRFKGLLEVALFYFDISIWRETREMELHHHIVSSIEKPQNSTFFPLIQNGTSF